MRYTVTLAFSAAVLFAACSVRLTQDGSPPAPQQSPAGIGFDRLVNADGEPANWLTYSGTLSGWRHSGLTEITPANVKNLARAWTWASFAGPGRVLPEATALALDGVLYTVRPPNDVVALDGATGRERWTFVHTPADYRPFPAYRTNRGLAMLGRTLFMGTIDARLLAINADTGALVWSAVVANPADPSCGEKQQCYAITHAPLVVKDKVLVGTSGGDGGVRGFIAAFDATSGKEAWRFHTIPGPGEPGHETWADDSWRTGGAAVWNTGSYDPELNLTYWGTGNPVLGNQPGTDLLYSNSVVALDADTGRLRWHYQFTPRDTMDWDATQVPVLADLDWRGQTRTVMLFANRNGVFYVLDRTTGEFLSGTPFVQVNWLARFDHHGRPIPAQLAPDVPVSPGPGEMGATSWYPPSYSPRTGLFYVPAWETSVDPRYGALLAIDPRTGEKTWEFRRERSPGAKGLTTFSSGALTTASGLVFSGVRVGGPLAESTFYALDAVTGDLLWQASLPGASHSGVMTYAVNGRQFVAITAGTTLLAFALRP